MSNEPKPRIEAIAWDKEEREKIEAWAKENNVEISYWVQPLPMRKENIARHMADGNFFRSNAQGFVIAESTDFKRTVLHQFSRVVAANDFYLYSVDHGPEPFEEEDFEDMEEEKKKQKQPGAISIQNVHVRGLFNAGTISDVQNIDVSISEIKNSYPAEFTELLERLVKAVLESKELDDEQREEAIARIDTITVDVQKAPETRKQLSVIDNVKGLNEIFKGATNLQTIWTACQPWLIQALPELQKYWDKLSNISP